MTSVMSYEFVGYHGTDSNCIESIQQNNFERSVNDDDWLGYGVYFFVEGINEPVVNASEWAKNQAYDKDTKGYKYDAFTVLEATVQGVRVLDTTTIKGLNTYNTLRNALIQKHKKHFVYNRKVWEDDCFVWNLVAKNMNLDVVIHNLYIKDCIQRRLRIASNVPNTTVMCVKDADLIDKSSINVIVQGEVR